MVIITNNRMDRMARRLNGNLRKNAGRETATSQKVIRKRRSRHFMWPHIVNKTGNVLTNVTFRCVRVTTVTVENLQVLHILNVCL